MAISQSARTAKLGHKARVSNGDNLGDPKAGKAVKSAAASTLTQKGSIEKSGGKAASNAGKVLRDPRVSTDAKSAAAPKLAQKKK